MSIQQTNSPVKPSGIAVQSNETAVRTTLDNEYSAPQSRHDELLAAALAYADHGLYVMPLHEPIFDTDGNLSGCTCEAYKRSKKYFEWLRTKGLEKKFDPNFKCPEKNRGKHPRISDWETLASIDPEQIKAWWHKWPTANIGLAVGKSSLITFDLDSYKEVFGDGGDLFSQADKQTVTQLSGGGGEHLVYQMPQGKAYTNANNSLPAGIDIRGVGGMQVLAPSVHPSGRRYEWEDNYSILEREPLPLPQALQAILDAAQTKSTPAKAITFSAPTTDKPELIRWHISKKIRELIYNPAPVGQRSQADMKVVTSLCYAGASDDEILAVFQHYPIGTQGKFAEPSNGERYLGLTIGHARTYIAAHPRPDVAATIASLRLWIRTHSFEAMIRATHADAIGNHYMTDSTDTRVADAILDVMEDAMNIEINIGKKRLGSLAGVSCNTAFNALTRLKGWLFNVTLENGIAGAKVAICGAFCVYQIDPSCVRPTMTTRDQSGKHSNELQADGSIVTKFAEVNEYSPNKATEHFLTGTSRFVKNQCKQVAAALSIAPTEAEAKDLTPDQIAALTITVTAREARETYTLENLNETCLRLIDAHLRCGDMTGKEAAAETGKKFSSIGTAYRRMMGYGIVEATREDRRSPYTFSLSQDWKTKIDELAPQMRNYTIKSQRENKRLESAQVWAKKGIAEAQAAQNDEQAQRLERRFAKLAKQRLPHLDRLHADKALTKEDMIRLAYEVADYKRSPKIEQAIRTQRTEARDSHRADVRLIVDLAADLLGAGVTAEMVSYEIMKFDLDETLVNQVLHSPELMRIASGPVDLATLKAQVWDMKRNGAKKAQIYQTFTTAGYFPIEIAQAL